VSFQIWQRREPTGKPISGSYEWTALTGTKSWDISVDEEVYCQEKSRSLSLKSDSQNSRRHCSKHLGCIHPTLLNIELVVDELHLMLRVGDVLLRNLILYADSRDHASREHQGEDPIFASRTYMEHCCARIETEGVGWAH